MFLDKFRIYINGDSSGRDFKLSRVLRENTYTKGGNYGDARTSHLAHRCKSWLASTSSSYLKAI